MRLLAPASTHHTGPTPLADWSRLYELIPEPLINVVGSPRGRAPRRSRARTPWGYPPVAGGFFTVRGTVSLSSLIALSRAHVVLIRQGSSAAWSCNLRVS